MFISLFILLLIFLLLYATISTHALQTRELESTLTLKSACEEFASQINIAALSNGYRAQLLVPNSLNSESFTLMISNSSLSIMGASDNCFANLYAGEIYVNNSLTQRNVSSGMHTVRNEKGVVYID
ncbi:MAG: hypothetical protein ABIH99_01875 [Candidatus Micrarchaeota archaeon]